MRVCMYMYIGWDRDDELATRLITIFGTTQGFRGAFGANPCGLYVCIRWYWNENVNWLVWAMERKLKWYVRMRDVVYCYFLRGKGWELPMVR